MKQGRIFRISFKIILILLLVLLVYNNFHFVFQNSHLKAKNYEQKMIKEEYLAQLEELTFIVECMRQDINKSIIIESVEKYRDKKKLEWENKGISRTFIDIPVSESSRRVYGLNGFLKFDFDENDQLIKLEFSKFSSQYD